MAEEAQEAAEATYPETEWSQQATILALREAFIRGHAAGVAEGIRQAREAGATVKLWADDRDDVLAAIDALSEPRD